MAEHVRDVNDATRHWDGVSHQVLCCLKKKQAVLLSVRSC